MQETKREHPYKKLLFGAIKIILLNGNGGYTTQENRSWYVQGYTLIYKLFGVVFHSVTIARLTHEQAAELL